MNKNNNLMSNLMAIFAAICMALVYWSVKSFLGLFMSDNLSWVGLSLLLTWIIWDVLKTTLTKE